jgi:hypothetical protein
MVVDLSLEPPYDLLNGTQTGVMLDIGIENELPWKINFSDGGTKLHVLYAVTFGGTTNFITGYELSTPYDLSTATPTGSANNLVFPSDDETPVAPLAFAFDTFGERLFVGDMNAVGILTYNTNVTITIEENGSEVLANVDANDGDGGETEAGISYSLASGGDNDLFAIDATTGELSFIQSPDFETPLDTDSDNTYELTIIATDADGSSELDILVRVLDVDDGTLSLEEANSLTGISVYPNPAKDLLFINNSNDAVLTSIEIYDLQGRMVKKVSLDNLEEGIDLSALESAVYMIRITSKDEKEAVKRFIIE